MPFVYKNKSIWISAFLINKGKEYIRLPERVRYKEPAEQKLILLNSLDIEVYKGTLHSLTSWKQRKYMSCATESCYMIQTVRPKALEVFYSTEPSKCLSILKPMSYKLPLDYCPKAMSTVSSLNDRG